ncbi:hypothetical protein DUNSADRAFT_2691 [Dunaliella salina]|uniref:Uncharacterized protein n=1 Tax=Dunaliella salina TaxID=3046 RepID=A0ABQ7H8B8_DUNSA|nr:hypothetical protein DUNSADRAFT_2691 [Dunaliella salina]|eukprot:KAF5843078.1 hypothetical protein DUNSADRAFT_2691 [Dunaliella salina]
MACNLLTHCKHASTPIPGTVPQGQDPYLDAGGGHGYEVAPPASPPGRGMPSAQPKWGTWSVGSDEGRLSSSSAAAADTAAAAATNQDGTAVAAATNQDGTAVAAAAHQAGTGITLMQQMREQLRRSQQSSADEGSVQERGHLRRSQQSSADEGSVEERGQRAGESAPLSAHSSAPLPQLITDRPSEGRGHSDTVPAGAQGELPVAPSGKLESEPRVRQDDHQEASDAHQPLQQRAYSTVASALEAPPTHPCPPASPPSHKPRASRLPQAPPPSQLPSPPPQPHLHRQHSLNAPQPSQPHLHRQHSLNAPQPPQPHLHRQHSINGPQTPQPHLHRQHSLHAPRPVVRTPSPGRAAAGSGTHKTIAAKGGKTRKPSPGRVAQNLALFGQAPRSPPVHPPPPSLQQSQLQVAQQHQPQVEPPLQQPRHTSQQHQPQREPPLLQTAQQQRPQIRAAADESQPAGELSGWRGGGCLDPAAALALATFQRHDPQLQQPSEGSLPLQQYHCEEAALQTAPNSRGASSVDVEPARNSDASTVSNSINDRRTVAYEPDLEGINKMRSVANESYLVGIDSRRTVANGLHSEGIVSTHSIANEPRPEGVQNTQSVANGPHQQGIDNGRSSANEPNLEGVDNGLSIAKEPPLEGTRVHEGPALPFTSLAAANAPALQMAPAAHTATHPAHAHTHSSPRRRLSRSSSSSSSAHASSASRPAAAHPPGLIAAASHTLSPGGHLSAESSGSAAASAAMGPRPALSDVATAAAAAAVAANREWLQPHAGPRGVRPGAVPLAVARTRAQRVPPRPRKWDKSVHVQPLPLTQARFVHELQMEEMAFQREQDQYAGGLNKAPPPPKSIKEPPDDQEERLQLMYYREVAARKMQSKSKRTRQLMVESPGAALFMIQEAQQFMKIWAQLPMGEVEGDMAARRCSSRGSDSSGIRGALQLIGITRGAAAHE